MKRCTFETITGPHFVSGNALIGQGFVCSMDGIELTIIAKNTHELELIADQLGIKIDMTKSMPLGFAPLKSFSKP